MIKITESTPAERAAVVTYWLATGREITTTETAETLQISQRTAQRLLVTISRTVPIYRDETGLWRMVEDGSPHHPISPY